MHMGIHFHRDHKVTTMLPKKYGDEMVQIFNMNFYWRPNLDVKS